MQPSRKPRAAVAVLLVLAVAALTVVPAQAAEPSCGRGITYVSQPKRPDDLLDFMINLCNFIASKLNTCCWFVDPYGDIKEVATDHPEWLGSMLRYTAQDQQPGDFVQTSNSPWRLTVIDSNVCSNVNNNNGAITCTLSHSVARGLQTTVTYTYNVGTKVTVSAKGKFDLIVAGGELTVSTEVSFGFTYARADTATTTTTETVTAALPVSPGDCTKLWIQGRESEASGSFTSRLNLNGYVAMWFDNTVTVPGESSAHHLWLMSVADWVSWAQQLGYQLDPAWASLTSNVWTQVEKLSFTYMSVNSYAASLSPTDPTCTFSQGSAAVASLSSRRVKPKANAASTAVTKADWAKAVPVKLTTKRVG